MLLLLFHKKSSSSLRALFARKTSHAEILIITSQNSRFSLFCDTFVCFLCLFVRIKPEKLYSASCVGREINPLEVVTHGHRHKPRACQRQRYKPRTCQSMLNTLQVDGLARTPGLTPALYKVHPQPTNGVPPCPV